HGPLVPCRGPSTASLSHCPGGEPEGPRMAHRRRVKSTERERSGRPGPVPRPRRPVAVSGPARVCIVVADNQAIDRGGIVGLLETVEEFDVVGESATVEETIQECRTLRPDV